MANKILYTLDRPFWDGAKLHDRGDKLYFEEGTAPRDAVAAEVTEKGAKAEAMKKAANIKADAERVLVEAKAPKA